MKSMQEEGLRLIQEAEGILRRDAQGAFNEKDFNMVVRRAQEVVELTLKGALKTLGVDYPKVHDVAPLFSDQVRQKRGTDDPTVLQRIEHSVILEGVSIENVDRLEDGLVGNGSKIFKDQASRQSYRLMVGDDSVVEL